MNAAACAAAVACSVGLAAAVGATSTPSADATTDSTISNPVAVSGDAQVGDATLQSTTVSCDSNAAPNCALAGPASTTERVYQLPAPTGDPVKDFNTLQAAINNTAYDTIEGAANGASQVYTINGMLEITRNLAIRNLELKQLNTGYVVRTIYAAGGSTTPITLRLDNIKIMRGPDGSEATGSQSDSAGIWTTNVTPEFTNIELYGGGHGEGLEIVNSVGGWLTDVYVHDITWTPYPVDQQNPAFWPTFTLATLQAANDWNHFQIMDYDGHQLTSTRIVEQANGIILNNVTDLQVIRPHISKIQVRFSDGQVYPYQSDGITVVSANQLSIQNAVIDHVAEGIDSPGFPNMAIDIVGAQISDVPVFCFKSRGSYDARNFSIPAGSTDVVTIRNSTGTRCGMAAFMAAAGSDSWFENTTAVDTGMGPDNTASPGIGGVGAYRFMSSSTLPTLAAGSASIGMHIYNATVSNPKSTYMQAAFHSENSTSDPRTDSEVHVYSVSNPSQPKVTVSTSFVVVDNKPQTQVLANVPAEATQVTATDGTTTVASTTTTTAGS